MKKQLESLKQNQLFGVKIMAQRYGASFSTDHDNYGEILNVFPVEDDWQGFRHVGYMSVPTELAQKIESKELTIKEVATILNEESFL